MKAALSSFGIIGALALASALGASAADHALPTLYSPPPPVSIDPATLANKARFAVLPARNFDRGAVMAQSTAGATIALWQRTVSAGGTQYTYAMVGKDPFVLQAKPTYKVKAVVIPLKLIFTSFGNYTADPAAADGTCSPAGTAAALTEASPLFNSISGHVWNTNVGTGQYVDLFQRANYYTQTGPGSLNPTYHTTLTYTAAPEISINVSGGDVVPGTCGNIGMLNFASWDNFIQTQLMPSLAAQSPQISPPTTLTIFLLYNVVLFNGTTSNCCVLGYHSGFNDPAYGGAFHTYTSVEFDTSKSFTGVDDISAMSHEVAEWLDDPHGNNPTPSWGNIGQVSGCQANLEVGDPLSGTLSQIYMASNGYTYHVQDLAFTSWFYGDSPSSGVNGWYSFLGNFLSPAAPC